jgi:HK97 family phage major capsid protein
MRTHRYVTKSFNADPEVIVKSLKEHGDAIAKFKEKVIDDLGEISLKSQEHNARLLEVEQIVARGIQHGRGGDHEPASTVIDITQYEDRLSMLRDGTTKSVRLPVRSFTPSRVKATTNSAFPGQADRDPELYYSLTRPLSVRDLLITRPTTGNTVDFVKATRSGNAAPQYDAANPTLNGEGALKKQIDLTFAADSAKVSTLAVWTAASRQVIDDVREMQDFINTTLLDAVQEEEDAQLLYGDGTAMNLHGLIPQAAAYSRGVTGDGPNATIRRAITQVQLARGTPTGLIVNPVAFELLELETDEQGRYLVTYNVTQDGRTTSWRVPVVATDAMQENQFLIGDFVRAARLYDRQQATVMVSLDHADFFTRNLVAVLAEERITLTVPRPQLLVQGSFTPEV